MVYNKIMKIAGIVAEFNPFHYGHKYLIDKIKNDYQMDLIVAAMSPNFVMRGEIAIFNKFDRTKMALENGIDMVIEIPTIYAVESASVFSLRAVELLADMGVTDLFFGVENDDQSIFEEIVKISSTENYKNNLKKYLDEGYGFNAASKKALVEINSDFSLVLSSPNNALAIEYLKAINLINPSIIPHFIKRVDSSYFDTLNEGKIIQSASAIRELIKDELDCKKYVPFDAKKLVHVVEHTIFDKIKYRIISTSRADLHKIKGVTEGFEGKLKSINSYNNYEELVSLLVSKRNRESKIKRMLIYILLNIKKDESTKEKLPYVRILGFNNKAQTYLKTFNNPDVEIYTAIKKGQHVALYRELDFTEIYSLISNEDIRKKEFLPVRFN